MKINISLRHATVKDTTKQVIEDKINRLQKYYDNITGVDVLIKEESVANSSDSCVIEIKMDIPNKKPFVATGKSDTHEKAIDKAIASLKPQILKLKEKKTDHRDRSSGRDME